MSDPQQRPALSISFKNVPKTSRPTAEMFLGGEEKARQVVEDKVKDSSEEEEEEEEAWLQAGLVVSIKNTGLANGQYYGKTGIIKRVIEEYGGEIHVAGGDIIKLDQAECSTVLPAVQSDGLVVRGQYRSRRVKVIAIGEKDVEVELVEGSKSGHRIILLTSYICRHIAIDS